MQRGDGMKFTKMHGLGNDFVVLEEKNLPECDITKLARFACERRRGVGADGLVIISSSAIADWKMNIYNSDGSEAEMCGNALRCVGKYLFETGLVNGNTFELETYGLAVRPLLLKVRDGQVEEIAVDMGKPILSPSQIPVSVAGDRAVAQKINAGSEEFEFTAVSMGNPHCVIFTNELQAVPLEKWGPAIEGSSLFPNKTNVEFAQILARDHARMVVWERGVGPTQACGSGACAVLTAGVISGRLDRKAKIDLPGGTLTITWNSDNRIIMAGPAANVFQGELEAQVLKSLK